MKLFPNISEVDIMNQIEEGKRDNEIVGKVPNFY